MLPRFFGTGTLFGIPSAGAEQWFGEDASWLSQWKGWSLKESQHASDQNLKGPKGVDNLCWFVDILWHTPISLYSILYQSRLGLCGWVDQGHVWHRKICSKCCISWGLRRSPQMCAVTEVTCLMQATSVLPVQLCRWVSVEIANRISQDPIPTASRILQAGRVKDLESTCYVYIDLLHL